MDKKQLTEQDIRTKYITPAITAAGWNIHTQVYEEFSVTDGRIVVRGRMHSRQPPRRADYVLCYQKAKPIAVIEAKDNKHRVGDGMQQALDYADKLDIPFAITSNGDSFLVNDRFGLIYPQVETEIALNELPGPDALWNAYCRWKDIPTERSAIEYPYHEDVNSRTPRYYQMVAINRTIEAVARGQNRILLVMATGTGKTFTAFQIIWRLWKSKQKKRILFLADRNILVDQTMNNDFKPFAGAMAKLSPKGGGMERNGKKLDIELAVKKDKDRVNKVDTSYEIYLGLYQALSGTDEERNVYKQFSRDFFDLIVIDECHRGSASEESAWRAILEYFDSATHVGLTATPKETKDVSNIHYFGEPIYTYSLKQGIDDGFLAPYKVIRVDFDKDLQGWRPSKGQTDKKGQLIDDRIYNQRDFDRTITMDQRTELVTRTMTEYMQKTDPMQKTIVFCENIDHAERMKQALINLNPEQVAKNRKYVMRITGDDKEGKDELDNFIDPEEPYPVIAVTSKLMTTGVDAKTCKLIVLDQRIQSMTEFKQIIGRGTRIDETFGKHWFTILDFKKATELFADEKFDGPPEQIYEPEAGGSIVPPEPGDENTAGGVEYPGATYDPNMGCSGDPSTDPSTDGYNTGAEPWGPGDEPREPRKKFHVGSVEFSIIDQRVQYLGSDGKLISESLTDFTRKSVQGQYATLNDFIKRWNDADRKQAVIDELSAQGVSWEDLTEELKGKLGDEPDPFDVILHIVYGQPALTRKQRVVHAKRRRNIFDRYNTQAQAVLDALLDKYADTGVQSIEDIKVLKLAPFDQMGTPMELLSAFGGKDDYTSAVRELETSLYEDDAG